jgi:glycosyltransferase involved in cell wall biosynthesis
MTCKILALGQTPPPYSGQTVMMQELLKGHYRGIEVVHVPMRFSMEVDEFGRFKLRKFVEVLKVIGAVVIARITSGATVLYYVPAPPKLAPVLRDLAILGATRWMFRKTVFHFHAGGIGDLYEQLPRMARILYRRAYYGPDLAIRISAMALDDARKLRARSTVIVPNGVSDEAAGHFRTTQAIGATIRILYVGLLSEVKGTLVLLHAAAMLRRGGAAFALELVGRFVSPDFERVAQAFVSKHQLSEAVTFSGVKTGKAKNQAYASSDIFCLPSFHPTETFSVAIVEAMSFGMPTVATRWRGIPDLVEDGATGFLFLPQDALMLADRLQLLISDAALRQRMGARARAVYEQNFTVEKHRKLLENAFRALLDGPEGNR